MAKTRHLTKLTGLRLPDELLAELDAWCATRRPPSTRTAAIIMIVEEFLEAERQRGWKPPAKK